MNPVRDSSRGDPSTSSGPRTQSSGSKPGGASNPAGRIPGPDPATEPLDPALGGTHGGIISNGGNPWERVDETISRVEQTLLVTFLGFIIFVAFVQIILRNLFATGLDWGDSLVRNLVLWIGFIGATLATKEGKHINIDVVSRWLPSLGKEIATLITHLFSLLICCLLTFAALKFLRNEIQMGHETFLNIPAWIPELILPLTFGLMIFRFGLRSIKTLFEIGKINPPHDREKET